MNETEVTSLDGRRSCCWSLGAEEGFSLPEILITMSLLIVLLTILVQPLMSGSRIANRELKRAVSVSSGELALYQMTRELRQSSAVYSATSTQIDVAVTSGGTTRRVIYKCDSQPVGSAYKQCVRASSTDLSVAPSITGAPVVVSSLINGTADDSNTPVFGYTPTATAPTYVTINLLVPASNGAGGGYLTGYQHRIALNGGVYLRNLGAQ